MMLVRKWILTLTAVVLLLAAAVPSVQKAEARDRDRQNQSSSELIGDLKQLMETLAASGDIQPNARKSLDKEVEQAERKFRELLGELNGLLADVDKQHSDGRLTEAAKLQLEAAIRGVLVSLENPASALDASMDLPVLPKPPQGSTLAPTFVRLKSGTTVKADGSDAAYLHEDNGSAIFEDRLRYADANAYWIYKFDAAALSATPYLVLDIQNDYLVQISVDGAAWTEAAVPQPGDSVRDGSNRREVALDLGSNLSAGASQVYVKLSDRTTADGWGPGLHGFRLSRDGEAGNTAWKSLAASAIQGLANREQGRIFVLWDEGDEAWIDILRETGYDIRYQENAVLTFDNLPALVKSKPFKSSFRGLLVYDPAIYDTDLNRLYVNVFTAIAAEENLIPVPADKAALFELPVLFDARQRWSSVEDAYRYVIEQYPGLSDRGPLAHLHPTVFNVRDYLIAHRILPLFYWQGMSADMKTLFDRVLRTTGANQPLLGAWNINTADPRYQNLNHPKGIGDEHTFMREVSGYGKYVPVIAEQGLPNLTYHSGLPLLRQDWRSPNVAAIEYDPSKTYIALNVSDGDNVGYLADPVNGFLSSRWWEDPARGAVKVNWSISPIIKDLMPGLVSHLYGSATAGDHFVASVSGLNYMVTEHYGTQYQNRDELLSTFYATSAAYMDAIGLKSIHLLLDYGYSSPDPVPSGDGLEELLTVTSAMQPKPGSILLDYGRRPNVNRSNANFIANGVPVLHSVNAGGGDVATLVDQIRSWKEAGQDQAFMNVFVENWRFTPGMLSEAAAQLGSDYVFVDAETLGRLYAEHGNGTDVAKTRVESATVLDGTEASYLYQNNGSAIFEGKLRYADLNQSFVYRFDVAGAVAATLAMDVQNHYLIQVSADGSSWHTAVTGTYTRDGSNRTVETVDLTPYLADAADGYVYVRIGDASPEDGWGGAVYGFQLTTVLE